MAKDKEPVQEPAQSFDRFFDENERRMALNPQLTEEDRDYIRQKAREHVAKKIDEQSSKAKDKLLDLELKRAIVDAEKEIGLQGAMVDINVELPPNCLYIMLDGMSYWHGQVYEVSENVARTLEDVMARTYEHDNEIHGQPRRSDRGRRPRQAAIGLNRRSIPGLYDNRNTANLPRV